MLYIRNSSQLCAVYATDPYGALNAEVMKKSQFSTDISLSLGNDTRQGHSYYGTSVGTRYALYRMVLNKI